MKKIRWGLLGSGNLLNRWMNGFLQVEDAEIAAIAAGDTVRRISAPVPQRVSGITDEGYQFEIRHVNECLRKGLKESPLVTHAMTRDVLTLCDELRGQWGLVYPFETSVSE